MSNAKPTQRSARRQASGVRHVTWWGLAVNLFLVIIKFLAGYFGRSQAVMADAVHSLTDCVTDIVLLVGVGYWTEPPDAEHPHGHRRIETLVALIIGLSLALAGVMLGWKAVEALLAKERYTPRAVALVAALLSLVIKEILFRWTLRKGRQLRSSAVIANAWHHRADALSSLPAAAAVALVMFNPEWAALDQMGAMVVTLFILVAAWDIMKPALAELIDAGAPAGVSEKLGKLALEVPGVVNTERIRTRFVGGKLQVDMHVRVDANLSVHQGHKIAHEVYDKLTAEVQDVVDVLVHIEPAN